MTSIYVPPSYFGFNIFGQSQVPIYVSTVKHGGGNWNNIVGASRPLNGADPNDPAYNWTNLDSYITYAIGKKYQIEYVLGFSPEWASGVPKVGGVTQTQWPPILLSDYTNWATAYLTRYSGKITAVETWNEVSDSTSLTGYAGTLPFLLQMETSLRAVIDAVSPTTMLLTPSTFYGNGLTYHANYFAAGGGQVCDGLCWHAYPLNIAIRDNYEQWDNTSRFYKALLTQYGKADMPIWITEGGYSNAVGDAYAMGSLLPLFMASFANVSMPFQWNRPPGGNTSLDYWLGTRYPQDPNMRGMGYKTMMSWLSGSTITQIPTRSALTNMIRNPNGSGSTPGIIGSGGVVPTYWSSSTGDSAFGVTTEVLGTMTDSAGNTGIGIRIYGTATAGASGSTSISFESTNQVLATFGQQMNVGATVSLAAGSMTNLGAQFAFNEQVGGSYLNSTMGFAQAMIVPIATPVYWNWKANLIMPAVNNIIPKFGVSYTVGKAFDATFIISGATADAGSIWTAQLTLHDGTPGLIAWDSNAGWTPYTLPAGYTWRTDASGNRTPVLGTTSALNRAPCLFAQR